MDGMDAEIAWVEKTNGAFLVQPFKVGNDHLALHHSANP